MKKVLLMVALALTTLTMSAQEDSKWTVKAGVGLSSVVGDDVEGVENIFSYKVGLSYDLGISENFSIIPEVEFANKGYKSEVVNGDINKFFLQIPVFAAYKFNVSDNMKLAIKAGPYVAYGLLGSDIDWYNGDSDNIFDIDERFDAGIIAGLSLDFEQFTVGIEYNRGLTEVEEDCDAYNQGFGVTFGYKF